MFFELIRNRGWLSLYTVNYSDYSKFRQEIKIDWGEFMTVTGSFLISLTNDDPLRMLTFGFLADHLEKEKHEQNASNANTAAKATNM